MPNFQLPVESNSFRMTKPTSQACSETNLRSGRFEIIRPSDSSTAHLRLHVEMDARQAGETYVLFAALQQECDITN
eukprot:1555879-Rhodomonas_salina.1